MSAMIRLLFLAVMCTCSRTFQPAEICLAGPEKCDGTWTCMTGILNNRGPTIKKALVADLNQCKLLCQLTPFCLRLTYTEASKTCSLYRQGTYQRWNGINVCVWQCCDGPDYCRKGGPRCPGHWQHFLRAQLTGGRIYSQISCSVDLLTALDTCRRQPICGGVTHTSAQQCHLTTYTGDLKPEHNNTSEVYMWKCCSHDDSDLDCSCRAAAGKCFGRWRAIEKRRQPRNDTRLVSMFHSLTKFDCLDACEANPFCNQTYFNQTAAICLLKSNVPRKYHEVHFCDHTFFHGTENYEWFGYLWECCDRTVPELKHADSQDAPCLCLDIRNASVEVAADDCGQPHRSPYMRFVVKSSLAAFWSDARHSFSLNSETWVSANNGEFQVWLQLGISHAFPCPARHCHVFSPRLDPLDSSCPEIVPREAWFARPPTVPHKRFPMQPIYGVIVGTGCPVFGCFTKTSCSSIMRIYQNYHINGREWKDIGYNFVIGNDGRVYEGVGWSNQNQHPPISYMSHSMLLAFVGRFEIRAPNADSMRAARQLLKCLQHRKKISPRYELQPLSYFTPNYNWPGKELKELLVNWNHFQGIIFTVPSCPADFLHLFLRYGTISFCVAIFLTASLVYLYVNYWRHSNWCPARKRDRPNLSQTVVSEAGSSGFLLRNLQWLPEGCTLRNAASLQLQPTCTKVVVVGRKGEACGCLRLLQLMWLRCCIVSNPQFPKLVADSLVRRSCSAHTVLVLTQKLYVLHLRSQRTVVQLLSTITTGRCACRGELSGEVVLQPDLAALSREIAKKKVIVADVGSITLRSLQRFFINCGGRNVEINFDPLRDDHIVVEQNLERDDEPLIVGHR